MDIKESDNLKKKTITFQILEQGEPDCYGID